MKASVEDEWMLERYVLGIVLYSTNLDAEAILLGKRCDLDGIVCDTMGHIEVIN